MCEMLGLVAVTNGGNRVCKSLLGHRSFGDLNLARDSLRQSKYPSSSFHIATHGCGICQAYHCLHPQIRVPDSGRKALSFVKLARRHRVLEEQV
jgi:hypothetical protein